MYSNTAHIYQQSKLPGMDLFLLDIMLQKLGMSCITTSGKKHASSNHFKSLINSWEWQLMPLQLLCMLFRLFSRF